MDLIQDYSDDDTISTKSGPNQQPEKMTTKLAPIKKKDKKAKESKNHEKSKKEPKNEEEKKAKDQEVEHEEEDLDLGIVAINPTPEVALVIPVSERVAKLNQVPKLDYLRCSRLRVHL